MENIDSQVVEEKAKVVVLTNETNEITVESEKDVERASEVLSNIAKLKKQVNDRRLFFVKPLNDQVKKINDLFKQLLEPVEKADVALRGKVLQYRRKVAAEEEKERIRLAKLDDKRAENAAKAGRPVPPPRMVIEAPITVGKVTANKVWKWRVVDASKVPSKYMIIDERIVNSDVRSGVREIPGIEVFEEEQLSVRK